MSLGLYLHIPFCVKKCAYCDFASFENKSAFAESYVEALIKELKMVQGRRIDSIFIGGGTPTSMDTALLERLISACFELFIVCADAEITIEANPGTVSAESLKRLRAAGINRISFGVQSLQDQELCGLGRIHRAAEAEEAVAMAREARFENINLDLMFGLPDQSMDSFADTIQKAIALKPTHLSVYGLIVEEGTPFYEMAAQNRLNLPDEETEREMYRYGVSTLSSAGYAQYEISNFALPGFECCHNIKYWQCKEYIGAGLGAHSYLDGMRYSNTVELDDYIRISQSEKPIIQNDTLTQRDLECEYLIMGFRMCKGIDLDEFKRTFGYDFYEKYRTVVDRYVAMNLMEIDKSRCRLTLDGVSVSNTILCEFV